MRAFLVKHGSPGVVIGCLIVFAGCQSGSSIIAPFTDIAPNYEDLDVESMRTIAQEIEAGVYAGNREPALTNHGGIVVDTPAIRQAVRARAARVYLIQEFLDSGHSWERRNGRVWIIRSKEYSKSTTGKDRDRHAMFVITENRDRFTIYETLRRENRFSAGAESAIMEIFFEARLEHMSAGQQYEAKSGEMLRAE